MLEQNAVVRLAINGVVGTEGMTNVLHFRVKAVAGVAAPEVGLGIIASAWANAWNDQQNTAWSWTDWQALQVRGTDVTYSPTTGLPSGGQTFEGVFGPVIAGALAAELLPPSTSLVCSLRTGFSGKTKRGRAYIMGLTEAANNGGTIVAASLPGFQAILDGFLATYKVGGGNLDWELGIWSYRTATDRYQNPTNPKQTLFGGAPNPAGAYTGVTVGKVDPQWGSMRSRSFLR